MRFFEKLVSKMMKFGIQKTQQFIKKVFYVGIIFGFGSLSVTGGLLFGSTKYLLIGIGLISLHFVFKKFGITQAMLSLISIALSVVTFASLKLVSVFYINEMIHSITSTSLFFIIVSTFIFLTSKDFRFNFKKIKFPKKKETVDVNNVESFEKGSFF